MKNRLQAIFAEEGKTNIIVSMYKKGARYKDMASETGLGIPSVRYDWYFPIKVRSISSHDAGQHRRQLGDLMKMTLAGFVGIGFAAIARRAAAKPHGSCREAAGSAEADASSATQAQAQAQAQAQVLVAILALVLAPVLLPVLVLAAWVEA